MNFLSFASKKKTTKILILPGFRTSYCDANRRTLYILQGGVTHSNDWYLFIYTAVFFQLLAILGYRISDEYVKINLEGAFCEATHKRMGSMGKLHWQRSESGEYQMVPATYYLPVQVLGYLEAGIPALKEMKQVPQRPQE